MADSSEPAFLFLYRKEAVAPVDYLSTFATAPSVTWIILHRVNPRLCADVQGPGEFYPLNPGL